MMNDHFKVGHKYPSVKINTAYSFGLDDQEFIVPFETDSPADFLDLVMDLREVEGSLYTLRDTPILTCIRRSIEETLDSLRGEFRNARLSVRARGEAVRQDPTSRDRPPCG